MIRNLWYVIRHFKVAFLLNVLGLAVAFTAFMMIMMQVRYDLTFDTSYEDADAICRLDIKMAGTGQAIVCRPLARLFCESSPDIMAGCIMSITKSDFWHIEKNGVMEGYMGDYCDATPQMPDVFGFEMTEGSSDALETPNSAIIPESMARRIFGEGPVVGKILHATTAGGTDRTITGVYKDFPENVSLGNIIYTAMDPKENYDHWGNWNYVCVLRLSDPAAADRIIENFKQNNSNLLDEGFTWGDEGMELILDPLPELHFRSAGLFDMFPKASKGTLNALTAIAFIILLIAGINFTNFSTALTPMRIRGINTRKVLGSTDAELRRGLTVETVVLSLTGYLVSILVLYMVSLTPVADLLDCDMAIQNHIGIVLGSAAMALVLGLLSGIYPAFYMTSIPPALALKGNFGLTPAGRRLRNILVGVQFAASFALVIAAGFIYMQNRYMMDSPLGFDKDQVIVTTINDKIKKNLDAFAGDIRRIAGVEEVAFSHSAISQGDFYMTWGREIKGENISFTCFPVTYEFLDVMGIGVTEGRNFRAEDEKKDHSSWIFNETAKKQYGLEVGDLLDDGGEIIGFVPDIHFASFRQSISPMGFMNYGREIWGPMYGYASIRVSAGTDLKTVREEIERTLKQYDPEFPFSISFYDSIIENSYQKEQRTGSLITLFSAVAIFISIVGVFSLVMFDCQYRRKETAVRKVLGSTSGEIVMMFCRSYLVLLSICFVIGAPVAWYAVDKWIEGFAYRTPMHWWVFPLAFIAISAITILTVTWQSWKAANENPVENLQDQ